MQDAAAARRRGEDMDVAAHTAALCGVVRAGRAHLPPPAALVLRSGVPGSLGSASFSEDRSVGCRSRCAATESLETDIQENLQHTNPTSYCFHYFELLHESMVMDLSKRGVSWLLKEIYNFAMLLVDATCANPASTSSSNLKM